MGKLEFLPRIEEEASGEEETQYGGKSFKLGSVAIAKTDPIRRFIIGVAPLIFGVLIIFLLIYLITVGKYMSGWWMYILAGVVIFQVANSMFSSKKDLEGAVILLVLFMVILLFLMLLGVDVTGVIINLKFSPNMHEMFKMANIFLLVPVVIDTAVLFLLRKK